MLLAWMLVWMTGVGSSNFGGGTRGSSAFLMSMTMSQVGLHGVSVKLSSLLAEIGAGILMDMQTLSPTAMDGVRGSVWVKLSVFKLFASNMTHLSAVKWRSQS
jgi:hypothetical protein